MIECVSPDVASTGGRELEGFDGEWEVRIVWVVDKESVDDIFLDTLGFVTWGDQGASITRCLALLQASGLSEDVVVHLKYANI